MKIKNVTLAIAIVLAFTGCQKDEPNLIETPTDVILNGNRVWVVNEGNFQLGNASLSVINTSNNEVYNQLYRQTNNASMGDVFHSISIDSISERAYLVINNSGKIEVVNKFNLQQLGTINGLTSPRYIVPINNTKAYVTDLFEKNISVINLSDFSIEAKIKTSGWTENILYHQNYLFALQANKSLVYKINPQNNVIEDSLALDFPFPNSMEVDAKNNLWVLCGGASWNNQSGGLVKFSSDLELLQSMAMPNGSNASHLQLNQRNDTLMFLNEGIKKMGIQNVSIPSNNFLLPPSGVSFYSFGYNPKTNQIFAGDAVDYVQSGKVYRYSAKGILIDTYTVGIIPGRFYFD